MIIIIQNQINSTRSYLAGTITISANSNLTVPTNYVFTVCRDSGLISDCLNGNVFISDGMTVYGSTDAVNYLNQIADSILGAVVGLVGSVAPNYAVMVGSKDPNGNTILASIDSVGQLNVKDVLNVAGTQGSVALSTTAVEVKVGASRLTNRKSVTIRPTNGDIYWGLTSSVTTSTGTPIYNREFFSFGINDANTIYIIAAGSVDVRITES